MDTELVTDYQVDFKEFEDILFENILDSINSALDKIEDLLEDRWVFMENKDAFYDNKVIALYPDLNHYQCTEINNSNHPINKVDKDALNFSGFKGDFMTLEEVRKSFKKNVNFPFKSGSYSIEYNGDNTSYLMAYKKDSNTLDGYEMDYDETGYKIEVIMPIFRLNGENSSQVKAEKVLYLWLKQGLMPQGLNKVEKENYQQLLELATECGVEFKNENITFSKGEIADYCKGNEIEVDIKSDCLKDTLLNGDRYRADIESYDPKILTDPNRGHWNLWKHNQFEDPINLKLDEELFARDPRADIKDGGVIGIDFGTKSTVVVHQEDSVHTLPMRVGVGQFSKQIEEKHYENPTVMEFIDLESFMEQYSTKLSRPDTLWEDITVSHTAFNSLMESSSEHYYSILSDLKQWAGDKKKRIRLKDKSRQNITLPTFLELDEDDVNPIELYAYYIGLYINNQHNGIYLDYILSFPVTYERKIRTKIQESFKRGLKKSLPLPLYDDEEVMDRFRVSSGASEPAAYAICALEEYEFEPFGDEKVFYGVFDFGGGTTDFDFGIWQEADIRERRYDFVIEHFGAEGDKYLGGENLLELLAFEVFKENQKKLRQEEISFALPPECDRFPGSELLLNQSQEAKLNMKQLMEELRPLWERHEGYEQKFNKGIVKVNLFDKSGQAKPNFELTLDQERLEEILRARIEKGVRNFFDALRRSFDEPVTRDVEKINIFLAGNSSKSEILKELFQEYIAEEVKNILGEEEPEEEFYEVFPPLGTEAAYAKQEEREISVDRDAITKPTGKTGVAFGLVESRQGGNIKVINNNVIEDEAKFKYFIGINRRKKFRVIIDRETAYEKWHYFIDAGEEDFEVYYTSLPEASRNRLDISKTSRKKCRIDKVNKDALVYLRAVGPTVIEYVVATEEGIKNGEYLGEIKQVELN
ncbi:hypothetical protein JCM16358_25350 [Halanaerocella petrolearia]